MIAAKRRTKTYRIWEIDRSNRQEGEVHQLGTARGRSFREACRRYFRTLPKEDREYFHPRHLTYFGEPLFETKGSADEYLTELFFSY